MREFMVEFRKVYNYWDAYIPNNSGPGWVMVLHKITEEDVDEIKEACKKDRCKYNEFIEVQ